MLSAWRYAACSVTGTSHIRSGSPCQDHAEVTTLPAADTHPALVAAVADGAGSAIHSDEGARHACLAFLENAGLAIDWVKEPEFLDAGHGVRSLQGARESIAALANETGAALEAFACTLLGGIVGDHSALFVQLGDGAIALRSAEQPNWRLAAAPQRGEFANQTIFVTRTDAGRYLQIVPVRETVLEVALMSDGVEFLAIRQSVGHPHAPFLEHVFAPLRRAPAGGPDAAHAAWLAQFLDSEPVNRRTDDDKTLVLATRVPPPA